MQQFSFSGLGTKWSIILDLPQLPQSLLTAVVDLTHKFESRYSRFLPDSEISKINHATSPYPLSPELEIMLEFGLKLKKLTNNHFNLSIAALLSGLGYNPNYSFSPNQSLINQDLPTYEIKDHHLVFTQPPQIDLGSLGKGFLIDKIANFLTDQQIDHFLIDGGGDIFATQKEDNSPWQIAIEHPHDPSQAIATLNLNNQAVATSSSQKRRFADNHHLLNPKTKTSSSTILSISILSSSAFIADALATAFFVTPANLWPILNQEFSSEQLIIYPDLTYQADKSFSLLI